MARIRTIKPEFFKHSGLFDAEQETCLPVRLAFAGLWTCCDREGRFKWRPRELKIGILPYDELDFPRVLDALVTRGFVQRYEVNGENYGSIPSWHSHQVINNREAQSQIPAPTQILLSQDVDACGTREAREQDASTTREVRAQAEGKGKEGKGINPLSEQKTCSGEKVSFGEKPGNQISWEAFKLSQLLKTEIRQNKPDFRITPAQERSWGQTADRMIRLDGRDPSRIAELISWAQHDEFWKSNILSMDKLRVKFDAMEMKASRSKKEAVPHKPVSAVEQFRKSLGVARAEGGTQ
jgi:hypothetical protein